MSVQSLNGPLRVLFVESGTELGGPQIALLTMLRAIDRRQILPFYASLGFGNGNLPEQIESLSIPVFRLRPGRFRDLPATFSGIAALRRHIQRHEIDLVFSNGGHANLFARPAAVLTGRPCVWWVHGYFPTDPIKGYLIALGEQLLSADCMFANSEWTARELRADFNSAPPVRVVKYGIELARFASSPEAGRAARQALDLGTDDLVVALFGRLHPFKGQHIFLQAAIHVAASVPSCRFLLIGGTPFQLAPEYAAGLRRQAERSGLNGRIRFLGHRPDVHLLYSACDIVVHASVEPEPWGLVVSEAMAAGRAVIAAAAGGPSEMIEDGRTGRLVPPGDVFGLAAAITSLALNPGKRAALGAAARDHAGEQFDHLRAAQVMAAELRRVASEAGKG